MCRRPSNKVFPSVYIEGVTQLACDDITPQSPDFPYIQGLSFSIYDFDCRDW